MYLSAVCVCMALCFVGCSKDDDEPGGKGAMYEVTIEQSGDFRSFIKSVVVVANGTRLKDGATGESLASPLILSDEELAVEKVTLTTTGKAIEFAVSGSVVDGEDGVVNEPMQWVVTVYKNGKESEKKSIYQISEEMKALVEKANAGKLMPEDYAGGTFGVTNLGKLNSFDSVPLPQPPQPAIMAACTAKKMAVVVEGENGEDVIVPRVMMKLVIGGDHRILDGVPLASFLNDMKKLLEDPLSLT